VIASSYRVVDSILPLSGYEEFDAQLPTIGPVGYFDPGVTKIDHADMPRLLEFARDRGDEVTVLPYDANGLGMRFYLLVGEFDAEARRRMAGR